MSKPSGDVELVTIAPELAAEWLSCNTHNRSIRQRVVLAYAADMKAGNWQWNGESIKFAADGTLLDGQHRLAAIVEAGVTIPMLVIRNLPNETQETVDGGTKRKFADVLQLRGERSHATLSAVVRRVTSWESGVKRAGSSPYAPTNAEMLQTLEKYPWLREVALSASNVSRHCGLPASVIGLGMWLFSRLSNEDSDFFFARLSDSQGLVKGYPIYELRKTADGSRSVRGQRSEMYLTAILIKAWNAYRDGEQVGILSFKSGGAKPERFPEPH